MTLRRSRSEALPDPSTVAQHDRLSLGGSLNSIGMKSKARRVSVSAGFVAFVR